MLSYGGASISLTSLSDPTITATSDYTLPLAVSESGTLYYYFEVFGPSTVNATLDLTASGSVTANSASGSGAYLQFGIQNPSNLYVVNQMLGAGVYTNDVLTSTNHSFSYSNTHITVISNEQYTVTMTAGANETGTATIDPTITLDSNWSSGNSGYAFESSSVPEPSAAGETLAGFVVLAILGLLSVHRSFRTRSAKQSST